MANQGYEVLVDELTVHKAVRKLQHPITGEDIGWQQGAGETWFLGEVIPASEINPEWTEALDSGDEDNELYVALSDKLKPSSDEPSLNEAYRLGLPFEGYDDMEEADILAAMRVLPSAAVIRIVEWERSHENRPAIRDFSIGFGVSPDSYAEGAVPGGDSQEGDDSKAVRVIQTREVPESGPVIHGEGITGTGEPPVAPGTAAAAEEADNSEQVEAEGRDPGKQAGSTVGGRRAGRRPRPQPKQAPQQESDPSPASSATKPPPQQGGPSGSTPASSAP